MYIKFDVIFTSGDSNKSSDLQSLAECCLITSSFLQSTIELLISKLYSSKNVVKICGLDGFCPLLFVPTLPSAGSILTEYKSTPGYNSSAFK